MRSPFLKFFILIVVAGVLWMLLKSSSILRFKGAAGEIGVVEIKGTIRSSDSLVVWINKLRKMSSVRGILLRVDSPGGAVAPTQEILEALKRAKKSGKPIVASFGNVAASGGYYVSLAADRIVANPGTVTGSIGVIAEFPVVSEFLKKHGIKFEIIKTGRFKDTGTPFREMKPEERRIFKDVLMDVYNQFVEEVAIARKMSVDSVKKIADGRVFTGRMALKLGLVDTLGSFDDAVNILKKMCGIKGAVHLLYRKRRRRLSVIDFILDRVEEKLETPQFLYRIY